MKKAGMMEIAFTNGIVKADAKSMMVDLKDIERMGMMMAGIDDVKYFYKSLNYFMENKDTKEFIIELNKQKFSRGELSVGENNTALSILANKEAALESYKEEDYPHIINRTGRGRHSKAWGSLFLAIKYAMYVNKELEVEVIDTFINSKILDFRVLGIDYNKGLNSELETLVDRQGKDNKGIYMQVAIKIKEKCFGSFHSGWDGCEDSAEYQKKRTEIQNELMFLIKKGYVKTYEDVKEYFNK
ncbi:MAG: hypothetical protein ACRC5G_00045 [Cetobacterium sp.]